MEKVLIFSAPSGSGKTSLVKRILQLYNNVSFSVSATSRLPRGTEKDGQDYYFLTPNDFKKHISDGKFIEWEEVYPDRYYGTLKSEVKRVWEEGKVLIFDVDVKGAISLKRYFNQKALSIFIKAPDLDTLKQRLVGRGTDNEESIAQRVDKAAQELTFMDKFDKVVINDDFEVAVEDLKKLIDNFLAQ